LFPFPFRRLSGLRRRGFATWQAFDEDSAFILSFRLLRPRFVLIRFEGADSTIDPVLYLDTGKKFSEAESFVLGDAKRHVCVVAPRSLPNLIRIRLDPSTRCVRFRLSITWSNAAGSLQKQLARASQWKVQESAHAAIFSHLGEDPLWLTPGGSFRPVKSHFFSVADHYRKVLGLAALRALHAPPLSHHGRNSARPLISFVVPTFNTPGRYLDDLLASFRVQDQSLAQMVLSDDGSTSAETKAWFDAHRSEPGVILLSNPENRGIAAATNAGIDAADGSWIGFVDHDDALSPHAASLLAKVVEAHPNAKFVYTDEIVANASLQPTSYFLKPAYDPVLLSGANYINHLSLCFKKRIVELGGLRDGFQGSQDYEFLLRYLDGLGDDQILHLPYPAYIWRRDDRGYSSRFLATATKNARAALAGHYAHGGQAASVEGALTPSLHRIRFDLIKTPLPKISVVIPNRDAFELLSRLLDGLETETDYPDVEIIVIDNGSTDPRVHDLYHSLTRRRPTAIVKIEPGPFNFARSINKGIRLAGGDLVLLLNNDIEIMEGGWLREMAGCFAYPRTGIVGARLLYPDRTIQHAGVIVGFGDFAGHWFTSKSHSFPGPMARLHVRQSFSAVTGACMLISRACIEEVGFFDEEFFAIAYNDIDFCLRAGQLGYRIVWTPFATLIHHESASRGSDETPGNIDRFRREQANLEARYATSAFQDRACNPWYTRHRSEPGLVMLDDLPPARV
jgi:O-antigen biosynthesis protein